MPIPGGPKDPTGGKPFSPEQTWGLLNAASALLPKASSGLASYGATQAARAVGITLDSAEADSALEVVGAQLSATTPRFQGPQSDKDVALYQKMVGDLANPLKTRQERMSALNTVQRLTFKYSGPGGSIRPDYREGMPLPKNWRPPTDTRPPLDSFRR